MDNLGVLLVILGGVGIWYFIKKNKDSQKRNISIGLVVIGIALVGIFGETTETNTVANQDVIDSSEVTEPTLSSAEIQASLEEAEAQAEAEKIAQEEKEAAEKAAKEEEEAERKKLEEEAAKLEAEKNDPSTYDTGITYDNLARNPDDYIGDKVKFYGRIIQVMESDDGSYTQYRFAIDGDYDTVAYIEISKDQLSSRLLEDDMVTIYGESYGTISYESTLGGNITVPAIIVNMFELNN